MRFLRSLFARNRFTLALAVIATLTAASSLAQDTMTLKARPTTRIKLPPASKMIKGSVFNALVAAMDPGAVPAADRLPMECSLDWFSDAASTPFLYLVFKGNGPVAATKFRWHWDLQACCSGTQGLGVGGDFWVYRDTWWRSYGPSMLPANLNKPPDGQPIPTCTAYAWGVK
jgi:hypothetical protein